MPVFALLGSGEFMPWAREVDTWCAQRATASSDRVLILPTAAAPEGDETFERWAGMGAEHYAAIGLAPHVLPLKTRDDASRPEIVDAVADSRLIFFSGGNPGYLAQTLRDTPFWEEAVRRWREGMSLAGSSAGAMALCLHSLEPRPGDRVPTHWTEGLGPVERVGLAVHARNRPREWLSKIASTAPVPLVALDDGVGVVLRSGEEPVVAGDGNVWVVGKG
jgi:cyanophycinase